MSETNDENLTEKELAIIEAKKAKKARKKAKRAAARAAAAAATTTEEANAAIAGDAPKAAAPAKAETPATAEAPKAVAPKAEAAPVVETPKAETAPTAEAPEVASAAPEAVVADDEPTDDETPAAVAAIAAEVAEEAALAKAAEAAKIAKAAEREAAKAAKAAQAAAAKAAAEKAAAANDDDGSSDEAPEPEAAPTAKAEKATDGGVSFDDLKLSPEVARGLAAVGYETPSPIQAEAIPVLLKGHDLVGQAQTGTGKTAAFALPLLSNLDLKQKSPQVLVLTPTRELAIQVAEAFQTYAHYVPGFQVLPVYGGQSYTGQLRQLQRGAHVVVGTPGRLMDLIRRKSLSLSGLRHVVIDEADEMLRMGFIDDVEWILSQAPDERQIALFSATMPPAIRRIAQTYLRDPVTITIKVSTTTAQLINQRYWMVSGVHKLDALTRILEGEDFDAIIVFVRTKRSCDELAEKLSARGFATAPLNGDVPQAQRERTVNALKAGKLDILVATDVAARGLDVDRISHVINYDVPYDTEAYIHRVGRTGRAGRKGEAILFVAPRERRMLRSIESATRQKITLMELPSTAEINDTRINKFKEQIADVLATEDLGFYTQIIESFRAEHNVPALEIASALAKIVQGDEPMLLTERQRPQRSNDTYDDRRDDRGGDRRDDRRDNNRNDRRDDRRDDNRGDRRDDRRDVGMRQYDQQDSRPQRDNRAPQGATGGRDGHLVTYRIDVGDQHGVRPGNIVGAICNEAGLETADIGRIDIHESFSLVDLPLEFTEAAWGALQNTWVSGQKLNIQFVGEEGGNIPPPRKAPRAAQSNFRKHKPAGKFQHKGGKKKRPRS